MCWKTYDKLDLKRRSKFMLYDLLKSRRSIRKFQNKEVEKEKIDIILKAL